MKHHFSRKTGALARLKAQIDSGVRNTKEGVLPLTEKDLTRVNREIEVLKVKLEKLK